MAKKVFDTPDLIRLIYSFGTPEHREFTRTLKTDLQSKAIHFEEYFQRNRDMYTDIFVCFEKHSKRELEGQLTTYARCFCCSRHSINMPILSNKKVLMTGPSVFENRPTFCRCPCRSLSRDFIRHLTQKYKDTYIN
jgi:hypothetical protein